MPLSLVLASLLIMVTWIPGTEATFGLTITAAGAAGAAPLAFTAAQVTAIAGVAILAKAGKISPFIEIAASSVLFYKVASWVV